MEETSYTKGWIVAISGMFINLALGILYAWSIFKQAITDSIKANVTDGFHWDLVSVNDPYALACLMFAFAMILGGRLQDKIGPRFTAMFGGVLVGSGFILCSQSNSYAMWILGFGVLFGMGMGFAYGSATPPALKWFPSSKTGLIAGTVVAGFGLAPIYIAPLGTYLLGGYGLSLTMLFFGIGFTIVVCGLANMLRNPPAGYVGAETVASATTAAPVKNLAPSDISKTLNFYILWLCFFISAGAGLMVIGSIAGMAKASMGANAFIAVAVMAIGNAGGRIITGIVSDKIGRRAALLVILLFQAALMLAATAITGPGAQPVLLVLLATLIGFNYGANLCLFPSFTKDLWGTKNFGANYGLLFTAWGVGGFVLVRLAEMLRAASGGSFISSFYTAAGMLVFAAVIVVTLLKTKKEGPVDA
ncbi:MAG: OFA family MFS transporter [Rhodospirillaceae bacterium]